MQIHEVFHNIKTTAFRSYYGSKCLMPRLATWVSSWVSEGRKRTVTHKLSSDSTCSQWWPRYTQTHTETHTPRNTKTDTHAHMFTHIHIYKHRERDTHTQKDMQVNTHTHKIGERAHRIKGCSQTYNPPASESQCGHIWRQESWRHYPESEKPWKHSAQNVTSPSNFSPQSSGNLAEEVQRV